MGRYWAGAPLTVAAVVSALALALTAPCANAEASATEVDAAREYDQAFQAMMADPTNTEALYRFAEAAVRNGDIPGAISALERILLIEPHRADIKLRLGELYKTAKASDTADVYLRQGLQDTAVPRDVRQRSEILLEDAGADSKSARRRHYFGGSLFVGGLYDTNANAGPDSALVRLGGVDVALLSPEDTAQDDFALLTSAEAYYVYDFGTQRGDALEANLSLYSSRYRQQDRVNVGYANLDVGPRFAVSLGGQRLSVRPFLEGSALWLADNFYRDEWGGGLNTRVPLSPRLLAEATIRTTVRDFQNIRTQPDGESQSGTYVTVRPGLSWQASQRAIISADALFGSNEAKEDFESYQEYGLSAALTQSFEGPFTFFSERAWVATASAAYRHTLYDAPEPQVDPNTTRKDNRVDLIGSLAVPVGARWSVTTTVQQSFNQSEIPNHDFSSTRGTVGINLGF